MSMEASSRALCKAVLMESEDVEDWIGELDRTPLVRAAAFGNAHEVDALLASVLRCRPRRLEATLPLSSGLWRRERRSTTAMPAALHL